MNRRGFIGALCGVAAVAPVVRNYPTAVVRAGATERENVIVRYPQYDPRLDMILDTESTYRMRDARLCTIRIPSWSDSGVRWIDLVDSGRRDSLGRRIFA